ncbi:MAG: hypothetical protein DBP02_10115 [gamma proteobacterium symbiont of Ctena orbiculata]|nr:MAG: hypothetical protein DBP02_10115 [gamma proteobacterium symbiont of Ctena orbiculata]
MTEDELERLMDGYETADLLDLSNYYPLRLNDMLFDLHGYAMQVCNEGITTNAEKMFDLADDLELELSEEIENLQRLLKQVEKLTELRPDYETE